MIETPSIVRTEAVHTAVVRLTVPRSEIRAVMGPGYQDLMSELAAQGVAPTGRWFTRHHRMDPEVFDFEIGVPVDKPVAASGRVVPSELPSATVARTVLRGPYEGLASAWGELDAWVRAQGKATAPWLWEVYLTDPQAEPDPASWRTELNRPLSA